MILGRTAPTKHHSIRITKIKSNTYEDIDCSKRENNIPKPNAYEIDRVGDGYDSCCQVFDSEKLIEQDKGDLYNQLSRDERISSAFGIRQDKLERIRRLSR